MSHWSQTPPPTTETATPTHLMMSASVIPGAGCSEIVNIGSQAWLGPSVKIWSRVAWP
jgi:hypothetical protein